MLINEHHGAVIVDLSYISQVKSYSWELPSAIIVEKQKTILISPLWTDSQNGCGSI